MIVEKVEITCKLNVEIYYKLVKIVQEENCNIEELINDILIDYFEILG